jgi:hypothetical protein
MGGASVGRRVVHWARRRAVWHETLARASSRTAAAEGARGRGLGGVRVIARGQHVCRQTALDQRRVVRIKRGDAPCELYELTHVVRPVIDTQALDQTWLEQRRVSGPSFAQHRTEDERGFLRAVPAMRADELEAVQASKKISAELAR